MLHFIVSLIYELALKIVMLVPLWGLFANMIAQIISQISSHFIIYYQRKIVTSGLKKCNFDNYDDPNMDEIPMELALCRTNFRMSGLNRDNAAQVRPGINILIAILGIMTFFLLILGCSLTSFRLEILGLTRRLIELGNDFQPAVSNYSIFTIFVVIIKQALYLNSVPIYFGLITLALLFLMTSLIVPCLHCISILILWFRSMSKREKNVLTITIEILKAWQYVEVYIIAAFLGMWQIGDLSESIVSSFCGQLDSAFASFAYYGIIDEQNARCFYAHARMEVGAYLLLVASILLSWLSNFVLEADKQRNENNLNGAMNGLSNGMEKDVDDISLHSTESKISAQQSLKMMKEISPTPSQFTDKYSWFLIPSQRHVSTIQYDESSQQDELAIEYVMTPKTFEGLSFEDEMSTKTPEIPLESQTDLDIEKNTEEIVENLSPRNNEIPEKKIVIDESSLPESFEEKNLPIGLE